MLHITGQDSEDASNKHPSIDANKAVNSVCVIPSSHVLTNKWFNTVKTISDN